MVAISYLHNISACVGRVSRQCIQAGYWGSTKTTFKQPVIILRVLFRADINMIV